MPSSVLSKSREIALEVLHRVHSGEFAETALSTILDKERPLPKDGALATELVYGVLRWRDRLDSIVAKCLARPNKKLAPPISEILRLAVYQLFFLDRIPDHAAVDQAVTQTRRFGKNSTAFVNAVLRKALRDRASLDQPPCDNPDALAVYYSHPEWLVRRWKRKYGIDRTTDILEHNNSRAPLELRVNSLKSRAAHVIDLLAARGIETKTVSNMPDALRMAGPTGSVDSMPGFREGLFLVQGLASQMIAPLLKPEPGQRILDACAAPGGKTSHIAALTNDKAEITALDSNAKRLRETAENLQRLGVRSVKLVQGDAGDPDLIRTLGTFDRILVDAPCANLGVLRHNPEAKYRIFPRTLAKISAYQSTLLQNTASALKRGGMLVYSVCSCSDEETLDLIEAFVKSHTEFSIDPLPPGELVSEDLLAARAFFATYPVSSNFPLDGFFAARLYRK